METDIVGQGAREGDSDAGGTGRRVCALLRHSPDRGRLYVSSCTGHVGDNARGSSILRRPGVMSSNGSPSPGSRYSLTSTRWRVRVTTDPDAAGVARGDWCRGDTPVRGVGCMEGAEPPAMNASTGANGTSLRPPSLLPAAPGPQGAGWQRAGSQRAGSNRRLRIGDALLARTSRNRSRLESVEVAGMLTLHSTCGRASDA